jgi:hypothetical protein
VPRVKPTDMGLGKRYNEATRTGLQDFHKSYSANLSKSCVNFSSYNKEPEIQVPTRAKTAKKLFLRPGMIPKYTVSLIKKFDSLNNYTCILFNILLQIGTCSWA